MRNGYSESIMATSYGTDFIAEFHNKVSDPGCIDSVRHEVFFGTANRKNSKQYGCWVYLSPVNHRRVHSDRALDLWLKRVTQEQFERLYGHDLFMQVFGRNYL